MEVLDYLSLTPEEKEKRKETYLQKKTMLMAGKDPERIKAQERALKALYLLKSDRETQGLLTETERATLSAIVVERCIDSFFFFARHVLDFDLLTEETHQRWADNIQSAIRMNHKKVMRLKPRGSYKSTLYGIAFILWVWGVYSTRIRIFYTSANSLLLNEVADKINQFVGTDKGDTLYSSIFGITKDSTAKNTSDVFGCFKHARGGLAFQPGFEAGLAGARLFYSFWGLAVSTLRTIALASGISNSHLTVASIASKGSMPFEMCEAYSATKL